MVCQKLLDESDRLTEKYIAIREYGCRLGLLATCAKQCVAEAWRI